MTDTNASAICILSLCFQASVTSSLVASPVAQWIKYLLAVQETRVQSLGWKDPLEKEMATHTQYSCLGNPMDRGAWQATIHWVTKVRCHLATKPPPLPKLRPYSSWHNFILFLKKKKKTNSMPGGLVNWAVAQREVCNLIFIDIHVKVLVNDSKTPRVYIPIHKGFQNESPSVFLPIIIVL